MPDRILERLDLEALATNGVAWTVGFIPSAVVGLLILFATYIFFRVSRLALVGLLERSGFHQALVGMLVDRVYRFLVLGFGLVMAADQVGVNVGTALAGIGVAGVAVGFAAQDTLANIIAGFLIFLDRPFMVGDWVRVGAETGEIAEITMRTTRIRTKRNTWVVIPNRKIIDDVLVNHSKQGATRVDVAVGIAYKESIPAAREVLLEAARGVPGVLDDPPPAVAVVGLGGSSVDLQVRVWIGRASDEPPVSAAVVEQAKLALDAAGIEIPYPHLQLFVDDVRPAVWRALATHERRQDGGSARKDDAESPS